MSNDGDDDDQDDVDDDDDYDAAGQQCFSFQLVDVNIPCQREIPMIYVFFLIIGNV